MDNRYIRKSDVYSLFGKDGIAKLHVSDIDRIPSADVAPVVHGRWIMRGGRRYCSACSERACVTRDMDDYWYTKPTNYCPNCGVRMDLEG